MNQPNNKKLFLRDEYINLLTKIDSINQQLNEVSEQIGEMTTQSSETWHDNAWFDECQRLISLLTMRKKELQWIIEHAFIIEPTVWNEIVAIGSKLLITIDGQQKQVSIGWYQTVQWRVSYSSPLWQALIGKNKGEYEITINQHKKRISIEEITW